MQERSKWLTYGGKVDEDLMNMLKEAQKSAGIKKFSDFMNDMLKIYRENKQDTEPPQMLVIKKAVTDIITTTENLLHTMQIVEANKFKTIADYQSRAQEAENNALETEDKIHEFERQLTDIKKDLATAQAETRSAQTKLTAEIERKKSIESMINRIQQLADDAISQKERAEIELNTTLRTADEAKNKVSLLETTNKDLQSKLESALATIDRLQEELISEKDHHKATNETLNCEIIARNRLEERMQIIEPHLHIANERLESLQTEINILRLNEQTITQKASFLEVELQTTRSQLQKFQESSKHP